MGRAAKEHEVQTAGLDARLPLDASREAIRRQTAASYLRLNGILPPSAQPKK